MNAAGAPSDGKAPDGITVKSDTEDEVTRLRAERDAAVSALNKQGRRRARRARVRRVSAAALVVVFAILLPVTIIATWAHRTVVNTDP